MRRWGLLLGLLAVGIGCGSGRHSIGGAAGAGESSGAGRGGPGTAGTGGPPGSGGGTAGVTGAAGVTGTAGTGTAGGAGTETQGSGTAGTGTQGGGTAGGGTQGTGTGGASGVSGTVGAGGTSAGGGAGGNATAGAGGGSGSGFGLPSCPASVVKGGACTSTDPQLCYKTCGPEKTGVKSEVCQSSGTYAEMAGCLFDPAVDDSCYAIPAAANAACPAGVPMASQACSIDHCVLCNSLGGIVGGNYLDSTGATKTGYCVCQPPGASGTSVWSCAQDTQWPCPAGTGCSGPGTGGAGSGGSGGSAGSAGNGGAGGVSGGAAGSGGANGGSGGTAGAGAAGTTGSGFGQPACPSTVSKGGACAPTDIQFCYKTCGPEKTGVKSESCGSVGTYTEMSGCSFDSSQDYSCYKIPIAANAACPATLPQASQACTVDHCVLCNDMGGISGGNYLDTTGATKVGYCVCQPVNSVGNRIWSCASNTQWPCPAGSGC